MKLFLMLVLLVSPLVAVEPKEMAQDVAIPMDIQDNNFSDDVESASQKIMRWITESREKRQVRRIGDALAKKDTGAAQQALDTLVREYPELKKDEPQALKFHQGNINFWKNDFSGAYKEYDEAIKGIEQIYPKGVPKGERYSERNAFFMGQLYFNRGSTLLHMGKYEEAVADINKAMLTSQPRAYMLVNKCRALLRLKRYKEAAEAYDMSYKVNAQRAMGAEDKAEICLLLKKNKLQPIPCQLK